MVPKPQQERILGMTGEEHREFGLIVVRNYDFYWVRRVSDQLYTNHKPTELKEESA